MAALILAPMLVLPGCSTGPSFVARYEPWREVEERACIASGYVKPNQFLLTKTALGGPSFCGAEQPFSMSAGSQGRIELRPAALLRCPMVLSVERWLQRVVEPAAQRHLGVPVVELKVAGSYSCRPINHVNGGRLSEHGYANAIDVSAFVLADGRVLTVKGEWSGAPRERTFMRAVHAGGCEEFTTVLGPDADAAHHDHFHLDLARRGSDGFGHVCK